jgi:hypothetical protein
MAEVDLWRQGTLAVWVWWVHLAVPITINDNKRHTVYHPPIRSAGPAVHGHCCDGLSKGHCLRYQVRLSWAACEHDAHAMMHVLCCMASPVPL